MLQSKRLMASRETIHTSAQVSAGVLVAALFISVGTMLLLDAETRQLWG